MIIYLAGKYSGDVDANIAAARKVAIELWEKGYTAICPHLNCAHFENDCKCEYHDYLWGDFELIERSDAVVLLPGWRESAGAVLEMGHAEVRGIETYEYPELPELK